MSLYKLLMLIIFCSTLFACKQDKKDAHTNTNTEVNSITTDNSQQELANYSCPMNCEDGKTYTEKGSCPICKMDLALHLSSKDNPTEEKLCQCKKGECKCKKGACKCGTPGHDHTGNKV